MTPMFQAAHFSPPQTTVSMPWSALPPLLPVPMFGSDDEAGGAEDVLDGVDPKAVRRPLEDARVAMLVLDAAAAAAAFG